MPRRSRRKNKVCPTCGERLLAEDYFGWPVRRQCWRCGTVFKAKPPIAEAEWEELNKQRTIGRVKSWSAEKGYGFIEQAAGEDLFVHRSALPGYGRQNLAEGEAVTFLVEVSVRGARAINVSTAPPRPSDLVYTAASSDSGLGRSEREQVVLMLNDDSSFSYLPFTSDTPAAVQTSDVNLRAVLVAGGLRVVRVEEDLASEFEALLNREGLREQDIQRFLEAHQEFLLGSEYDLAMPQMVLPLGDRDSLRPDFVLRPIAGVTWDAKIVELKLPGQRLVRRRPVHREGMYAAVHDSVVQLRAYQRYFEEEVNRAEFERRVGFRVYRPKLALVLGRTKDFPPLETLANVVADIAPVDLLSYDDLILRYRRHLTALGSTRP